MAWMSEELRPATPAGPGTGTIETIERDLIQEEELWTDDSGADYTGWFCLRTDPWPCPAVGCMFVATHITAAHLIIVWPERDDPMLLQHAGIAKEVGRNPKVESYEAGFGPACSYYQWEAAGRPVHAVRSRDAAS
jgi:hypothetical protein